MERISERIRYVGVNDRNTTLFEGLWPLPYGVSYDSYLVMDEKVALIDTVEEPFGGDFIAKVREAAEGRDIGFLVVNHMEPDHSSSILAVLREWPEVQIIAGARAVPMLKGYYGISEGRIKVVSDGESVSLGQTHLTFYMTPMVHWPETMMTWFEEENTLFSADAFGTFGVPGLSADGTVSGAGVTDRDFADLGIYRDETIRYYSNIVGKYGVPVQTALKKLSSLDIHRICSTHGPVWEKFVGEVVGIYDRLSRYEAEKGVCIAFGTMYGNTEKAAKELAEKLEEKGVKAAVHDLRSENVSFAIADAFRYDTLILGSPTYNGAVFPPVKSFMDALESRGLKKRRFFAFGSYTWAQASVRLLTSQAKELGFSLVELPRTDENAEQGVSVLEGGLAFPQAFSETKFPVAALADALQ